jgi:hypothetical protein
MLLGTGKSGDIIYTLLKLSQYFNLPVALIDPVFNLGHCDTKVLAKGLAKVLHRYSTLLLERPGITSQ